jgi:integrating conjugative element membrane protein (TIGR03747 family)
MIFAPFGSDLEIMFSGAYLYGCRLAGLVSSIPLYFLICAVAIVDGLVERSVRRACLGNESAALYHRAKFWSFRLLPPISAMAWLCLPFPIHPIAVIAPTALFTGILLRLQMKYYKKYF